MAAFLAIWASVVVLAATVAIRVIAKRSSFGVANTGDREVLGRWPIVVNHDGRKFAPGLYDLAISATAIGIVACQGHVVAKVFYPAWWFEKDRAKIGVGQARFLWSSVLRKSVILNYLGGDGRTHTLEISTTTIEPEQLVNVLERADFLEAPGP